MNLILFSAQELAADSKLLLSDHRFLHIRDIHRAQAGDQVRVGEIDGLMGTAIITRLDEQQLELQVELSEAPPEKLPLRVLLALPRPKMLRRILRSCAELGISELHLINASKVEKSFWSSPVLEPKRVRATFIEGLQQARDTRLPRIELHRLFKPFVEDKLPQLAADSRKLVAHPTAFSPCPTPDTHQALTLAIGPEGGFTEYEVQSLENIGFEAFHLGPRILRVENAITALTSRLFPL